MKTTCQFLDAVKACLQVQSDYALAKKMGMTQQMISRYRHGKDFLSDSACIRVANLLEIDPAIVIASVHAERSKIAAEKAVWESIIERLGGAAAAVLMGIGLASPAPSAHANQVDSKRATEYTLSDLRRRKLRKPGLVDLITDWALQNRTFAA